MSGDRTLTPNGTVRFHSSSRVSKWECLTRHLGPRPEGREGGGPLG